jgi:CheY-like chemotaxis protein
MNLTEAGAKIIDILLVEDTLSDVRLVQEVLKDVKLRNTLYVVNDGVEAMEFLRKQGKYSTVPRPDIVLLDLNMPRMSGREVLKEVKEDEDLKRIPIIVMTVSTAEADILKSYNLHANCYLTKPVDMNEFVKMVKTLQDFWFTIVKLPPK